MKNLRKNLKHLIVGTLPSDVFTDTKVFADGIAIDVDGNPIELPEEKKAPLLQIELDSFGDVPKVFYKGEEITGRVSIRFDWQTEDSVDLTRCSFEIVHCENPGEDNVNIRTIAHKSLGE